MIPSSRIRCIFPALMNLCIGTLQFRSAKTPKKSSQDIRTLARGLLCFCCCLRTHVHVAHFLRFSFSAQKCANFKLLVLKCVWKCHLITCRASARVFLFPDCANHSERRSAVSAVVTTKHAQLSKRVRVGE